MANKNLSLIILIAVVSLTILVGILFVNQKINEQIGQIISIKKEIVAIEKISSSFKSKIAQANEYNQRFDNIGLSIVNEDEPREFTRFLQDQSTKAGVVMKADLNNSDGSKDQAIFFRISSIGKYDQVMNFLRSIERSAWLCEAYNIRLMRNGDGQITLTFDLKVYTKKYDI